MNYRLYGAAIVAAMVAACGDNSEQHEASVQRLTSIDVAEDYDEGEYESEPPPQGDFQASDVAVHSGKIAYSFDLRYEGDGEEIITVQKHHADMCRKAGPTTCRILEESTNKSEWSNSVSGSVSMEIAAPKADDFIDRMNGLAEDGDVELAHRSVTGTDLTEQIIDAEARLSARKLLRERLMTLLATKGGSVSDLVEAERAVADVTGDIETVERRLASMENRVEFSSVSVDYDSDSDSETPAFAQPIEESARDFVGIIGETIAVLIRMVAVLIPVSLFLVGLVLLLRKLGIKRLWPRRLRFWKKSRDEAASATGD